MNFEMMNNRIDMLSVSELTWSLGSTWVTFRSVCPYKTRLYMLHSLPRLSISQIFLVLFAIIYTVPWSSIQCIMPIFILARCVISVGKDSHLSFSSVTYSGSEPTLNDSCGCGVQMSTGSRRMRTQSQLTLITEDQPAFNPLVKVTP